MKLFITDEFVKNIIESYERLGFNISKEDIKNRDLCHDEVKVSFTTANEDIIEKPLYKVNIDDLNNAYCYKNFNTESEKDKILNKLAFTSLFDYIREDSKKSKVNKKIVDYLTIQDSIQLEKNANKAKTNMINKVTKIEDNKVVANKGRKQINSESVAIVIGAILISTSLLYAGISIHKMNNSLKNKTEETNNDDEAIIEEPSEIAITYDNTIEEPSKEVEETVEEDIEEEINVHSDEYINEVTEKIYNNIQGSDLAATYSKNDIKELVIYAHHSYEGFNGDNILSNETAYEIYTQFVKHGLDISMFYEGLNGYEDLQSLNNSAINIVQELGKYDDEYKVYKDIETTLNNMNEDNYTEAVALRAYVDLYTIVPSMQVAKGGAKENGEEGKTYEAEKASISEAQKQECKNIYNNVDVNNPDAKLTRIVRKALEEDKNLSR